MRWRRSFRSQGRVSTLLALLLAMAPVTAERLMRAPAGHLLQATRDAPCPMHSGQMHAGPAQAGVATAHAAASPGVAGHDQTDAQGICLCGLLCHAAASLPVSPAIVGPRAAALPP